MTVGFGAAACRSRPGRDRNPRECGPTFSSPTSSIAAMEPPPAPISIMSITGALIGRPEPLLKRCTRAASIIGAISARPSSIMHALAVVPPMSKEITSFLPASAPKSAVARPPPAGPDSSRRIGKAPRRLRRAPGRRPNASAAERRRSRARPVAPRGVEVAVHERLDIGVGAGGDAALVLPQLGDDFVRQRDREAGEVPRTIAPMAARARGCGRREGSRPPPPRRLGHSCRRTARTCASSSGRHEAPSRSMRSATSRRRTRGTKGSGNCRKRS